MPPISTEKNVEESTSNSRTIKAFKSFWNDISSKLREKNWGEISYEATIVLVLISLAVFVRVVIAYEYRVEWGIGSGDSIWDKMIYFHIPHENPFYVEGYADFGFYYYSWIHAWYEESWYPYQWIEPYDVLDYYSYPPVFLYFLILIWRPGMSNFWMAFPMLLADAACAGVVYLILKNIIKTESSRGVAIFGGMLMAIAPINVIYVGAYWLNPGPVTFLTLLAFYFAIKGKWWQTFFWLAVATMTKQNALFFTYPLFMAMLGEKIKNKRIPEAIIESIMNACLFLGVCFLLSIPWIFITPKFYGMHLLFPGRQIEMRFIPVNPQGNDCVSFAKSLEELGLKGILLAIASFGNYSMLWMVLSTTIIAVGMLWRMYHKKLDNVEFFEWIAVYTIFSHIFMPRGVYKFYTAYYVPMILIAILGAITFYTPTKKFIPIGSAIAGTLFLGFNVWLITIDRWPVPFYLFMVALTIGLFGIFRSYIRDLLSKKTKLAKVFLYLRKDIGT